MRAPGLASAYRQQPSESDPEYLRDDIIVNLRAGLIAVLANAVASGGASPDFLKGALALARSQAALYDIPWPLLVNELARRPELGHSIRKLLREAAKA